MSQTFVSRVFLGALAAVTVFLGGCRKAPDEAPGPAVKPDTTPPVVAAIVPNPYKEIESDTIDTKQFPELSDKQLPLLRDVPLLRRLILDNAAVTNDGMKDIGALAELKALFLTNTAVTDAGLAALKGLRNLEELRLDKLRISDAGLTHLKQLPNLKRLSLWRTLVTDEGLRHVQALTGLQRLSLDETRVSDEGLKELGELADLRYLSVWKTKVTDDGVADLKAKLPQLKVNR